MAKEEMWKYCLVLSLFLACQALPEQGLWEENLSVDHEGKILVLSKSMYNGSTLGVRITCPEVGYPVTVTWVLRWSPCAEEYFGVENGDARYMYYLESPGLDLVSMGYSHVYFIKKVEAPPCNNGFLELQEWTGLWERANIKPQKPDSDAGKVTSAGEPSPTTAAKNATAAKTRKRRAADVAPAAAAPAAAAPPAAPPAGKSGTLRPPPPARYNATNDMHKQTAGDRLPVLATTQRDGIFLFILKIKGPENSKEAKTFNVKVSMKSKSGYLSAIEWPFLPFYGIMCMVYVLYGIIWLVLSICNWKDLLRIQFWIYGVIFLGMLEKAVFFAEYESINKTGQSVRGAVVLAELVSCLKRTLARMLVVIVSIGFGIVKPRLGPAFHRVLGAGALYFILASIEGCLRELKPKGDNSNQTMLASIPLAVLDAAICWWVFTGLVKTTRTLRLRRNLVKLSLYRHFTNTLVIAVLASVAYMIWSIKQHKLVKCLTDWKELWVDEAFWHILFSVILLVIMFLWRPSINNQRYAFSPLLDADDEEAEEPMMSDAFDSVKMRAGKPDADITRKPKDAQNKAEEDLKWIEENIPASVADSALPSLLDSDEEVMTTKYEMSKME